MRHYKQEAMALIVQLVSTPTEKGDRLEAIGRLLGESCEEADRLRSELETERGHRQADNKESRGEIERFRKLLTKLVDSAEGYCLVEYADTPTGRGWKSRLQAALTAAKEAL